VQDFYPVHAAVLRRDKDAVMEALEYGVRFSKQDSEGNNPLHCAVAANDVEIATLLVEKGAPVNLPNRAGRTPTQVALLLVWLSPFS
jgi:ankyrin repeat protein